MCMRDRPSTYLIAVLEDKCYCPKGSISLHQVVLEEGEEYECASVLHHHTQDVKKVVWHPHQEASELGLIATSICMSAMLLVL